MSIPLPPVSIRDDSHEGDLLVALQEQLLESLLPALEQALGESAQGQFDQGRVVEHVRHALIAGFRGLPASKPAPAIDAMDLSLSLLSEDALETQLVREQVAEGASRPNARGLEMLGQRLARASRRDSLRASENPIAPAFIVHALAAALDEADPDARHRIAVLRSVERPLAAALAQAYERCEAMLASGSLPQRQDHSVEQRSPLLLRNVGNRLLIRSPQVKTRCFPGTTAAFTSAIEPFGFVVLCQLAASRPAFYAVSVRRPAGFL